MTPNEIREQILALVDRYAEATFIPKVFEPGTTTVSPSGKVFGAAELKNMADASPDGWFATGGFNDAFEKSDGSKSDGPVR